VTGPAYEIRRGDEPLVATAVHAGHDIRDEIASLMSLDESVRLREEDPYTDRWTSLAANRVSVRRSRFEVDLNRPRDGAVCYLPEDCWDLEVWRTIPPEVSERSLAIHDAFYADLRELLESLVQRFGRFVLYDLHSYNHRRRASDASPADPAENPEVNVGTGTLDRARWGTLVDEFIAAMRSYDFRGRALDVRENVRFEGGFLAEWTHQNFPRTGCALAIEVKKFFMDEHTGELDEGVHKEVFRALDMTVPRVLEVLDGM
jgi:N-formylglutamate deformylase